MIVTVVASGGIPVTEIDMGSGAPSGLPMIVTSSPTATPITIVAAGGIPATLINNDGSPYLGSSLLAWWRADRPDLITHASGAVSSWKDTVAAYDAVQAGAGMPTYSATSFNGFPGITFDGTDDELTLASQPFPSGASAAEMWAVVSQSALAADSSTRQLFGYGGTSNATRRAIVRRVSGGVNRFGADIGDNSVAQPINDAAVDFSGRHVLRVAVGATSTSVTINGGTPTSGSAVPATGTTRARIGASTANTPANFWNGIVHDIIITSALSASKAAQLQAWLMARR